jgi:hypothetical protein
MKNINLHRGTTLILLVLLAFTTGCYYDSVVPPEFEVKDVSFSTQVEPIFYTKTKCTSCHIAGGPASFLDLSQGTAYTSINDPKYIDLSSPESSLIYTKPLPGQGHTAYTAEEAAYVLQWIKEGALEN